MGAGSRLLAVLTFEIVVVYFVRFPTIYSFNNFAFWDWGGYLVTHSVMQKGYRPIVDFGWQYGLLPLAIQECWFTHYGASALSFISISAICSIWFTLVLARLVTHFGMREVYLATAILPFAAPLGSDLPHVLEPALLVSALLAQVRHRRDIALALVLVALFTKPVMAYVYAAILLSFIIISVILEQPDPECERRGRRLCPQAVGALLPQLGPAIVVGCLLYAGLAFRFGAKVVASSLWPTEGMRAYRLLHFGFRGTARSLFYFPGVKVGYYIGTPVLFWAIASVLLGLACLSILLTLWRRKAEPAFWEIALTCAILHFSFVLGFFGGPGSWVYYAYVLIVGLMAGTVCLDWKAAAWFMCVVALLANISWIKSSISAWRNTARSRSTAGLFVNVAELDEWQLLQGSSRGHETMVFSWVGAAGLLTRWIQQPIAPFLVPGVASGTEVDREVMMLRSAERILVPQIPQIGDPVASWPGADFGRIFAQRRRVFKGAYFELYE